MTGAAIAGCLLTLQGVTSKYFSYPAAVGIDIQHANDLDFPAITICNVSPMRLSLYERYVSSQSTEAPLNGASRRRKKRSAGQSFNNSYFYLVIDVHRVDQKRNSRAI